VKWLLAPYGEGRTYAVVAYLLLGLPLGIMEFTLVVTGLAIGLGMLVTVLGIPLLVVTLLLIRALAALERRLAWSLLGASMPRCVPASDEGDRLFWARLRRLLGSRRTWTEMGFLLLRLPLGVIGFTIAVVVVSLMAWGLAGPATVAAVSATIGWSTVGNGGMWVVFLSLPVGLVCLLVGPRLLLGWGAVTRRVATALLGRLETRAIKIAVGEILLRRGELDAFQILDDLELRFGRGPFLTPIRLEAALLALKWNGRLRARDDGRRTLYAVG